MSSNWRQRAAVNLVQAGKMAATGRREAAHALLQAFSALESAVPEYLAERGLPVLADKLYQVINERRTDLDLENSDEVYLNKMRRLRNAYVHRHASIPEEDVTAFVHFCIQWLARLDSKFSEEASRWTKLLVTDSLSLRTREAEAHLRQLKQNLIELEHAAQEQLLQCWYAFAEAQVLATWEDTLAAFRGAHDREPTPPEMQHAFALAREHAMHTLAIERSEGLKQLRQTSHAVGSTELQERITCMHHLITVYELVELEQHMGDRSRFNEAIEEFIAAEWIRPLNYREIGQLPRANPGHSEKEGV